MRMPTGSIQRQGNGLLGCYGDQKLADTVRLDVLLIILLPNGPELEHGTYLLDFWSDGTFLSLRL